jgi:ecotin
MNYLLLCALLVSLLPVVSAGQEIKNDLKPYPEPAPGVIRTVFRVPAVDREDERKVEILVGKTMLVDCNRTWFGGNLETQVAQGWGYSYFVLEKVGPPASTLMACPPGDDKTEALVPVRGEGFLQRYNSKLPVVVYVPEGFEVRYRIWTSGDAVGRAEQQ